MRVKRQYRCERPICTIGEYIGATKVGSTWQLILDPAWLPDELTREQQYLDRLMRQTPRPGRGGEGA